MKKRRNSEKARMQTAKERKMGRENYYCAVIETRKCTNKHTDS